MTKAYLCLSDPNRNQEAIKVPVICLDQFAVKLVSGSASAVEFDIPDDIADMIVGINTKGKLSKKDAEQFPMWMARAPGMPSSTWSRLDEDTKKRIDDIVLPLMVCL